MIGSLVAPQSSFVGIFLPYSPLHTLLLEKLQVPIVATSANRSGDPVSISCDEVVESLGEVVDFIVDFDRDIVNRCDDSVVRFAKDRAIFLRVGRGYAPVSFPLRSNTTALSVGMGGGQKVTLAMNVGGRAVVSPYIGDVATPLSLQAFRTTLKGFEKLYDFTPDMVACDRHPGYLTTQEGHKNNFVEVGHHHAHIVSCMAENGLLEQEVLGVAWDGTGLGDNGEVWGGEFLIATVSSYERVASFAPVTLIGGESAIKDPRKIGLGVLCELFGEEILSMKTPFLDQFSEAEKKLFYHAYVKKINGITTSSVGRLFDAVASLLGVVDRQSYEGESGLRIEGLACDDQAKPYEMVCCDGVWQWEAMVREIIKEEDKSVACSRFLVTLAHCVVTMAKKYNLPVVLSGGVFQNAFLVEKIVMRCDHEGIRCYTHRLLPPNDGGLSLGQLIIGQHL
jgi:hydrogenase maturation protein HypF